MDSHRIHLLCDDYEAARHHYETFDEVKFRIFKTRIEEMREAIRKNCLRKPFPSPMLASSGAARSKKKVRRKSEEKGGGNTELQESKTALLVTTSGADNKSSTPV